MIWNSRRDFLATTASLATATATPSTAPAGATARSKRSGTYDTIAFAFDRDAFAAVLARPFEHRQVTVGTTFAGATVMMSRFSNVLAAYGDSAGFGGGTIHCAIVLYEGYSDAMILADAMWAKYPIGTLVDEETRPNDTRYRDVWRTMNENPMRDFLDPLIVQGVSFFVCNHALSALAGELADRTAVGSQATRERVVAIYEDLAAHLIRGCMRVPSGAAAVNAVQEARFTLLPPG